MRRRVLASLSFSVGAALLALGVAGCSKSPTSPTPVLATDTFTGTVALLGADSKSFTVNYAYSISDAAVTLKSLTSVATSAPVSSTIGIAFGQIAFDGGCQRVSTFTATSVTVGQAPLVAASAFQNGTYCVQVFDNGTLTEPVNYTIDVQHY
jgi:hypothetical protein